MLYILQNKSQGYVKYITTRHVYNVKIIFFNYLHIYLEENYILTNSYIASLTSSSNKIDFLIKSSNFMYN